MIERKKENTMSDLRESTKRLAAHATLRTLRPGLIAVEFQGHHIGSLWETQAIVRPVKRWYPSADWGRLTQYAFEHRAEAVAVVIKHYLSTTGSSSAAHNSYMDRMELNDISELNATDPKPAPATRHVSVSTKNFEFAHGRKPRGRGCWIFDLLDDQGNTVASVTHTGTYGDAKKVAVARAKFAGSTDVELGS